jgi:hypothetical protein
MLYCLKADAECGALRKWLRQYHFGITGEMLTRRAILTFTPILVTNLIHFPYFWMVSSTYFEIGDSKYT